METTQQPTREEAKPREKSYKDLGRYYGLRTVLLPRHLIEEIEKDEAASAGQDRENLKEEQIDLLLMRLMSLSEQYYLTPQTPGSLNYEKAQIDLFGLADLGGESLLAAYEEIKTKESKEAETAEEEIESSDRTDEKKLEKETEESEKIREERRQKIREEKKGKIREEMVKILKANPQVRERYKEIIGKEKESYKKGRGLLVKDSQGKYQYQRGPVGQIQHLDSLRDQAKKDLRRLGVQLSLEARPQTGLAVRENPAILKKIIETSEVKEAELTRKLDEKSLGFLAVSRLLKYKQELKSMGFSMTPGRESLVDSIIEIASQGYKVFLAGATGSGKTSLGIFALKQLTEGSFEVISWSGETSIRDLFGRQKVVSTEKGPHTEMERASYAKAVIAEEPQVRGVLHDELTSGLTPVQISLKAIWAARPGDPINLPGYNGSMFTKDQLAEIATGNLKGLRHQEREEMDPAVAREFEDIEVPFLPSNEMRDIILADLITEAGMIRLSKTDVEMIEQLCRAAELSQWIYLDDVPKEVENSDKFKSISAGVGLSLTKVFLDSGRIRRMFSGYAASGRSLRDYLVDKINVFIKSSHFKELRTEKETMTKILTAHGFENSGNEGIFVSYQPLKTDDSKAKSYLLPSEMGFLISPAQRSREDEFGDSIQISNHIFKFKELDDGSRIVEVGDKKYNYTFEAHTIEDLTVQPQTMFTTGGKEYIYFGLGKNKKPLLLEVKN